MVAIRQNIKLFPEINKSDATSGYYLYNAKMGCAAVARKRKSVNHALISKGRQPLCSGRISRSTRRTPTKGKQKRKKKTVEPTKSLYICIQT